MHVIVTITRVNRSLMVAIAANTSTGDNEGENSEGLHIMCLCWEAGAGLVEKDEIPYKSGCSMALCQIMQGGVDREKPDATRVR
jgi:hypothetical protein